MKRFLIYVTSLMLIAAPFWLASRAADTPRTSGRLLLLDNERVMEGEIEKKGDGYLVRRRVGETVIPSDSVLCICNTMTEAYAFLRGRANLRDADERLRLARWCHVHGLQEQALAEARAALDIRPKSKECRRMVEVAERSANHPPASRPTAAQADKPSEPSSSGIEIDADTMGQFVRHVQPILMNTCASCHVNGTGNGFKLVRSTEGGYVSHHATQHNLSAALAQIDRNRWEASPLLIKSVSIHGQAPQPPIKNRQTAAFRALEEWVRTIMANNPQLQEAGPTRPAAPLQGVETSAHSMEAGEIISSSRPALSPEQPTAGPAKPADPFDPVLFNQESSGKSQGAGAKDPEPGKNKGGQ
jgi:hypothetical protein